MAEGNIQRNVNKFKTEQGKAFEIISELNVLKRNTKPRMKQNKEA